MRLNLFATVTAHEVEQPAFRRVKDICGEDFRILNVTANCLEQVCSATYGSKRDAPLWTSQGAAMFQEAANKVHEGYLRDVQNLRVAMRSMRVACKVDEYA